MCRVHTVSFLSGSLAVQGRVLVGNWARRNLLLAFLVTGFVALGKSRSFSGLHSPFWKTVV